MGHSALQVSICSFVKGKLKVGSFSKNHFFLLLLFFFFLHHSAYIASSKYYSFFCCMQVLCKSCDPGVGGRDFEHQLLVRFAEEFKKKYKIDTLSRPKQTLRLLAECEKVKKVMSTVTNPQTLSIECFADDKDVSGKTSRCVCVRACVRVRVRTRARVCVCVCVCPHSQVSLTGMSSMSCVLV